MTVGEVLSRQTGYKLFFNHISIEVASRYFDFGTKGFQHISETIRTAVFNSVLNSELSGLIFTYVWAFDEPDDCQYIKELVDKWEKGNSGKVFFLELKASQEAKQERNKHSHRLEAKASKRNIEKSESIRRMHEKKH